MPSVPSTLAGLPSSSFSQCLRWSNCVSSGVLTQATLPFLRASTTGELLIGLGHLLFALNLSRLVVSLARTRLAPAYAAATVVLKPAEVKP